MTQRLFDEGGDGGVVQDVAGVAGDAARAEVAECGTTLGDAVKADTGLS